MARKRVVVYLEEATIQKLEALGKSWDQNLSGVLRSIIAGWLDDPAMGRNFQRFAPLLNAGSAIPLDAGIGREAHTP